MFPDLCASPPPPPPPPPPRIDYEFRERDHTTGGYLFRIGNAVTGQCRCGLGVVAGIHVVEECPELEEGRQRSGEKLRADEQREGEGDDQGEEEEGDELEAFFYHV